jgi:hypothetical protein
VIDSRKNQVSIDRRQKLIVKYTTTIQLEGTQNIGMAAKQNLGLLSQIILVNINII